MKLFYRVYGEGKPIVIIHGLFGMSDNWIPVARELADKNKVYLLDMRNHGQSPHSMIHDYESMSEDISVFFNNQKIKKATLIGHSMGGKVVLQFGKDFPDKVEQLIVVDISPKGYNNEDDSFKNGFIHKKLLEKMMDAELNEMKNREDISEYFKIHFSQDYILQLIQKNIVKNKQNNFSWKLNISTLYNNLNIIKSGIDFSDNDLFFKVLFVFGSNSLYFKNEDKIFINEHLPYAIIKFIIGAGHFIHVEKKNELIETIKNFLI